MCSPTKMLSGACRFFVYFFSISVWFLLPPLTVVGGFIFLLLLLLFLSRFIARASPGPCAPHVCCLPSAPHEIPAAMWVWSSQHRRLNGSPAVERRAIPRVQGLLRRPVVAPVLLVLLLVPVLVLRVESLVRVIAAPRPVLVAPCVVRRACVSRRGRRLRPSALHYR